MKNSENVIASCVRIEQEAGTGNIFLVFQVTDSEFKKRVREEWSKDIELKLLGYNLIKDNDA